jgi:hypothetical protein
MGTIEEAAGTAPYALAVLSNLGKFRTSIFGGGGVGGDHRIAVPRFQSNFASFH